MKKTEEPNTLFVVTEEAFPARLDETLGFELTDDQSEEVHTRLDAIRLNLQRGNLLRVAADIDGLRAIIYPDVSLTATDDKEDETPLGKGKKAWGKFLQMYLPGFSASRSTAYNYLKAWETAKAKYGETVALGIAQALSLYGYVFTPGARAPYGRYQSAVDAHERQAKRIHWDDSGDDDVMHEIEALATKLNTTRQRLESDQRQRNKAKSPKAVYKAAKRTIYETVRRAVHAAGVDKQEFVLSVVTELMLVGNLAPEDIVLPKSPENEVLELRDNRELVAEEEKLAEQAKQAKKAQAAAKKAAEQAAKGVVTPLATPAVTEHGYFYTHNPKGKHAASTPFEIHNQLKRKLVLAHARTQEEAQQMVQDMEAADKKKKKVA